MGKWDWTSEDRDFGTKKSNCDRNVKASKYCEFYDFLHWYLDFDYFIAGYLGSIAPFKTP